MTIRTNFDYIRKTLLDPTQEGGNTRVLIRFGCLAAKVVSALFFCNSAVKILSSLVNSKTVRIFDSMDLAWDAVSCISSREVFVIAENLEKLVTYKSLSVGGKDLSEAIGSVRVAAGSVSDTVSKALSNALSVSSFVNTLFNNTWFMGSLFGPFLIDTLDAPKK